MTALVEASIDSPSTMMVKRGGSAGRMLDRCPQPLAHHRQAHDDEADEHEGDIGSSTRHHPGHAGGERQRASDLHDGREPVEPIVGIEGGGEPREVHPGPPDGEEHHQVPGDAEEEVSFGFGVVQRDAGLGDRDHVGEVEEELERRRRAVGLVRVPRHHGLHQYRIRSLDRPRPSRPGLTASPASGNG
jgi:hypothetical protein